MRSAAGATSDPIEQVAELHRVRAAVSRPEERRRLERVIRGVRGRIEPGVPKHRAARLLGISPQALERWARAGDIPTMRKPGSSRELIDRDALIRVLIEVRARRDTGEARPVGKAIAAMRAEGALRHRPRPNQPARELRYEHQHSSGAQRVRSAIVLSHTAHAMAARARGRRQPRER